MRHDSRIYIIAGAVLVFSFVAFNAGTINMAVSSDDSFSQWDSLFRRYGSQYAVPWRWLKAICMNESSLGQDASVLAGLRNPSDADASASSDGKSWGLMQVTLSTAQALRPGTTVSDLNKPEVSVSLAAELVAQLISRFGIEDRESVIRAYNGGPHFGALTLPYYGKFVTHLAIVMTKQPGNELE